MAKSVVVAILYSFLLATLLCNCEGSNERKMHIVYMGEISNNEVVSTSSIHHSMLTDVLGSYDAAKKSLVYSYGRSFNGFAAKLSDEEVAKFQELDSVVSVFPNTRLQLHTTRSWDFLGLKRTYLSNNNTKGGDVIVGVIDSGVWPEADSFSDKGFGPPPAKWKGTCQTGNNFTCNNKIIGARFYNSEDNYENDVKSPRDFSGHGTHTASTAVGNVVEGANFYGLAGGVARGGAPSARLATYKVCWNNDNDPCSSADILAAFDDAIADGVDIISISVGGETTPYLQDPIAIGSFHAMRKGILTSTSAGNGGPYARTIGSVAPWLLTVAASSTDRRFLSHLVLGNGKIITGSAINPVDLNRTFFPLIFGGDAANVSFGANREDARTCGFRNLNSYKVEGKIVFCYSGDGVDQPAAGVQSAGGVGVIISGGESYFPHNSPIAATGISDEDGASVLDYIKTTRNPIATIFGETLKDDLAPMVAPFSSRGINPINPDIIKPDITAPGVDILAAWPTISPPTEVHTDSRSVKFNIISGTSMSCPHVSGLAAYIKAAHPTWSPSAIKSAIMTTANVMDPVKNEDAELAYGSGHINPLRALHPGLVYDADESDYINFLCKNGYNTTAILRQLTGDSSVCQDTVTTGNSWDLNYPSFAVAVGDGEYINATFTRTVTNVGSHTSTYHVAVNTPGLAQVVVEPTILKFNSRGQKRKFTVKVSGPKITQQSILSGSITWSDGKHLVRSPLAIFNALPLWAEIYRPVPQGSFRRHNHRHRIVSMLKN